ncbi:hypothetical protein JZ751_029351 [Albula glossodonta]|uniref:Uncharacterized protein n=1 Tax=Albula glossodonta TaxID=121402 RepID=A0A8T2P690_9TELE|nr:hypothetical protein JZ751_029351 [Albula glossodonta]
MRKNKSDRKRSGNWRGAAGDSGVRGVREDKRENLISYCSVWPDGGWNARRKTKSRVKSCRSQQ